MRPLVAHIHLNHLRHNYKLAKEAHGDKVLAVLKANAYGHGVAAVLPALQQADAIGVTTLIEALEARCLGWDKTIGLIEGAFTADEWLQAIEHDISCVIHHAPQLEWALAHIPAADSATQVVWLKYNTGMNRLGFNEQTIMTAAKSLHDAGYQLILATHFANADDHSHPLNAIQIQRFNDMLNTLQETISADIKGSLCNSAGIVNFSEHHHDWVRPGVMLYGGSPFADADAASFDLLPVMTLQSRILAVQNLAAGERVGYGGLFSAERPTRVGIVACGYADGYPRHAPSGTPILVGGLRTEILGRVSMDMLACDLTDLPGAGVGSPVVLWGEGLPADEVAAAAGTISYELFCALAQRVQVLEV